MKGPLPDPNARRRNAPTIPTTALPASGRKGRPPKCPYELGPDGASWWKWAWTTPQAYAWDAGSHYALGRRARLEDDLASLGFIDEVNLHDLLQTDREAEKRVEFALMTLKRSASSKLALEKEMRELDVKFGLTPESMAKLRWTIVDDTKSQAKPAAPVAKRPRASVRGHLRAVDPATVAAGLPESR